jgi:Protein of unknown function (DUF3684)
VSAVPSFLQYLKSLFPRYLEELRRIASNVGRIEKVTQERMRRTPILLGLRRTMRDNAKAPPDDSDDEGNADLEYQLLRPSEVFPTDMNLGSVM